MTLQEGFDNFIFSRELQGLSKESLRCYREFVGPFLNAVGPSRNAGDLTFSEISAYLHSFFDRPLSKASIATYARHIKIFLRWMEEEHSYSYSAQKIRLPRSPKKNVHLYSNEEMSMIFDTVKTESAWITARNQTLIALMLDSGLRQNEACTLLFSQVDLKKRIANVHGKGDKERVVPLGRITILYLKEYLRLCPYEISGQLFLNRRGGLLTKNAVKLLVHRISEELPFDFSCHKLRHNFATNYCIDHYRKDGQVDIFQLQILMGHEDVKTTMRYLHLAKQIIASENNISHLDAAFIFSA